MVDIANDSLPDHARQLLYRLCHMLSIPIVISQHRPTFSAAETQSVLPASCLVQKTLTGRVADKIILWTGVGDFSIHRSHRKRANMHLQIPKGRDHTLNPHDIDALSFYGMQPGMVSPFLVPDTPALDQLSAVFMIDWLHMHQVDRTVAISLSLTESLIIPLQHLHTLLFAYANEMYGQMPIFTI